LIGGLIAEFTSHAPGAFSWVELATSDPKAGVAFNRGLFGWDVVEHDMGPSSLYTIFTMRGKDVASEPTQDDHEDHERRRHGRQNHDERSLQSRLRDLAVVRFRLSRPSW
jgi:catechol 2,3-dioxygenase-like lactoylglutathione lyase family enzyme